jgi:cytochrome c-type biogenesis protein CcmH/NrfG
MSGFVILVALIVAAALALWLSGLRGPMLKLALAAMMMGGGGYALQGRPSLPGLPAARDNQRPTVSLERARRAFFGEFNASEHWLLLSDSFARRGKTAEAAGVLQTATRKYPGDLPLWIGFANALVEHGGGMTPAARLAFDRAESIAPGHPATRFFRGLAMARSGDAPSAVGLWQEALADAPADASWRPLVEDGIAMLSPPPGQQP